MQLTQDWFSARARPLFQWFRHQYGRVTSCENTFCYIFQLKYVFRLEENTSRVVGQNSLKALANEDTLLRTHCCSWCFLGAQTRRTQNECCLSTLHRLRNNCCGHKMFRSKIRNIFSDTKFVSATNVARAGKRGNICVGNNVPATMCSSLLAP